MLTPKRQGPKIDALASLDHKHVVRLIDSFESDGKIHIVTEYIAGKTLYEYVQAGLPGLDSLYRYAVQLLEALDYIHSRGIVHSDLKPQNIIIDWKTTSSSLILVSPGLPRRKSRLISGNSRHTSLHVTGTSRGQPL